MTRVPADADVEQFRRDLAAISPTQGRLLVAVSGGADSLALLLLAHAALGDDCSAATVDHALRPQAASEAAYVGRLCAERGIAHAVLTGDLPARAQGTANLSTRARALRYQLLFDQAAVIGAAHVATAHHADDQLETLVMRLNRGAGLAGLAGIRAASNRLVRPLLGWRREPLARIVAACGVVPIDDPTNRDDRFDRARVRKQLAAIDWLDAGQGAHSARFLQEADEALAATAATLAQTRCVFRPGVARLDAADLLSEFKRRLAERCLRHVQPDARLRGSAVARVVAALDRGEQVMIADVLCSASAAPAAPVWHFRAAPIRGIIATDPPES